MCAWIAATGDQSPFCHASLWDEARSIYHSVLLWPTESNLHLNISLLILLLLFFLLLTAPLFPKYFPRYSFPFAIYPISRFPQRQTYDIWRKNKCFNLIVFCHYSFFKSNLVCHYVGLLSRRPVSHIILVVLR